MKIDEEVRTMVSFLNPKLERKAHNLLAAVKRQESSSGLSNGEGQWEKELNFTIAAVWQIKETIM